MHASREIVVFFDLDGTLTDPFVGIANSYDHMLARLGYERPAHIDYRTFVGPPIRVTLDALLGPDPGTNHEGPVAMFREHFSEIGLFENTPYDGVEDMLERLAAELPMYVCTSKPKVYADRILEKFGFEKYFRAIYGCELDGTLGNKVELFAHMLERESLVASDVVMIGDRLHDIRAAVGNGAVGAGVLWGYGSALELNEAGASRTFASPNEVTPAALRELFTHAK